MKNMKKTIVGVAIIAMLLITMMGSVNAASLTVSPSQVEKGKTVTVTINSNIKLESAQFDLAYDTSKFEYVSWASEAKFNPTITQTATGLTFAGFDGSAVDTAKSIKLTFKAKDVADKVSFKISDVVLGTLDANDNTLANNAIDVKVVDATVAEEPKTDNNANTPSASNGTTTSNGASTTTKTSTKVGTDGKAITKLPQTGAPLFIGAAVIVALAGVVLVVRKRK